MSVWSQNIYRENQTNLSYIYLSYSTKDGTYLKAWMAKLWYHLQHGTTSDFQHQRWCKKLIPDAATSYHIHDKPMAYQAFSHHATPDFKKPLHPHDASNYTTLEFIAWIETLNTESTPDYFFLLFLPLGVHICCEVDDDNMSGLDLFPLGRYGTFPVLDLVSWERHILPIYIWDMDKDVAIRSIWFDEAMTFFTAEWLNCSNFFWVLGSNFTRWLCSISSGNNWRR